MAIARLNSITPRTRQRAQEVAQCIVDLAEPFQRVDALFAALETERSEALRERLEELRQRGRALQSKIETELQGNVYTAMQVCNEAEQLKGGASTRVMTHFEELRSVKKNRFATQKEISNAEQRLAKSKQESESAAEQALKAHQALAEAENAMKLAQAELEGISISMDQCQAELAGKPYHSPELGLAVDPTARWAQ